MSAASPSPLPRPDRGPDDRNPDDRGPDDHGTGGPLARSTTGTRDHGRAALSVAGRPPVASSPADPPRGTTGAGPHGPRVRLVPRAEPPAGPLPATTAAHLVPPELGSPDALARPRPLSATGDDLDPPPEQLPDPTRTCCAIVQAAVEGLRGVRPLAQLTWWVTPEVYEALALRAGLVQGARVPPAGGRAGIRRVRVCRIGDGAAEATVVVDDGPRVRAVALRVEEHRGRWRATALEIG